MTRRERDILKASISWTDKTLTVNEEKAFIAGAKWADKTMIEKACQWLINIDFDDFHFRDCDETFNNDLFVDAFRKAMEK